MSDHDHKKPKPDGDSGTQLAVRPQEKPAKPRLLPPFKLLLHNDDTNTMEDVVRAIVMLTPLAANVAIRRMLEAHEQGVALLLTTHKERGELYVDQFASLKITTTLEPDA